MRAARVPARAEVVGSLLRAAGLRAAIEAVYEPGHRALLPEERAKDLSALREAEDEAIREAVARQESLGLDVVTDGEFRRYMFLNSFWDAVEGFSTDRATTVFRNSEGDEVTWYVQRVEERLRQSRQPGGARDRVSRRGRDRPFKVTFPAASLFRHPFTFTPGDAYADHDELVAHAIEIERGLIADAIAAGRALRPARLSALPVPRRPALVCFLREAGHDVDALLDAAIAADNAVLEGIPDGRDDCAPRLPRQLPLALALRRARSRRSPSGCSASSPTTRSSSSGTTSGGTAGYEPIRHVPAGKTMVMGLVSTKTPVLEDEDDLVRRLDEAAQHLPLEQLALSPQCGFASVLEGNEIDADTQWRKLELVARVAERVWS